MTYPALHLLIDGAFVSGGGRASEPVINPATGRPLADLPHASTADLDAALTAAARAFVTWRAMTALDRGKSPSHPQCVNSKRAALDERQPLAAGAPQPRQRGAEAVMAADLAQRVPIV